MPNSLNTAVIDAHERLYPRLAALLKQVERMAARHPHELVPEATVQMAGMLCRRAAKLLGREGLPILKALGAAKGPRAGSLDHAGLVVVLGQAVAGLEGFEAAHSGWSPGLGALAWRLDGGGERPVSRLRPTSQRPGAAQPAAKAAPRDFGRLGKTRSEALAAVYRRMNEREAEAYRSGYEDARAGRPFTLPTPLD